MPRHLTTRLGEGLIAIWGVVTIVFIVSRLLGDPAVLLLPIGATEAQLHELRVQLGLDQPLLQQYLTFLLHALKGDFGQSFQFARPALDVVLERLPATAMLAGTALAIGVLIGGLAGALAAIYRGSAIEGLVLLVALLGQATPSFWLGIMLILFFAVQLGWFPTGGYGERQNLVLPSVTLACFTTASIARLLRSSMLDVMRDDYVRTAYAKGLAPRRIYLWHVGRNSLIPVVTMTGILAGELLGGAAVTETVFAWPGVGRLIVQAIETKDFPVVQAGVAVVAAIFVLVNLLVDLLYGLIDPRIRQAS
ncbi:MAG: ABC transporter permease [Bosea sp.]|uniref:ABC transporter permease n=1 Tax=unclassified Bosea (in: a-proteobacteria) TaxID=2653178 RepID=UPI0009693049|nr:MULTISPECIES: ABC transporter permease [unclassified Bosea (in: a-proteobacteria)]MBN9458052.1 ABC transporter permease [Bosea sp. (in: a-proteobacteria)]OJV10562.1 MAG: ABC transporter permease [Bosea sp. 67-29]